MVNTKSLPVMYRFQMTHRGMNSLTRAPHANCPHSDTHQWQVLNLGRRTAGHHRLLKDYSLNGLTVEIIQETRNAI